MKPPESTCWTLIQGAADGREEDRDAFARLYAAAVRAYLFARWKDDGYRQYLDDAQQEVFMDCFKEGGVLDRADENRPGGFRAFLYGVVRIVAMRFEKRHGRRRDRPMPTNFDPAVIEDEEARLTRVFDRAWAESIMKEAASRQAERARKTGGAALRRVELLHLRFYDDKPIREIASLWDEDPVFLHHEYARARRDFQACLQEVVSFHHGGAGNDVELECSRLLALLG